MDSRDRILHTVHLTVNGSREAVRVPAGMTLLELLRERLYLTGAKEGCGVGECGACTVLLDGVAVNSCLVLAVEVDGAEIQTVEGEAKDGVLSELQSAFIDEGAIQCGFCTPGMIMSARGLLAKNLHPTRDEIVEAMAGNLCRCTGYEAIIAAVEKAAGREGEGSNGE
ncbi:MAG: (2Fe-2S)-binding protein [Candidatus Bipolaricaulota bacterium]|nr:(2Fe-2S)-binding protein [Candidatus Bipolaricaulota bacterium]